MFSLTLHYQEYTHPAAFARPWLTMYQLKVITTKVLNDTLSVEQGDRGGSKGVSLPLACLSRYHMTGSPPPCLLRGWSFASEGGGGLVRRDFLSLYNSPLSRWPTSYVRPSSRSAA